MSAPLRKIRYHVLLSVWCQALWVVPERLNPLRLQWRPQVSERFNQSSHLEPLTGSRSPPLHQLRLSIYLLFLSLSLLYFSGFSSGCVTQFSERWLTSPLAYVAQRSQSQNPAGQPRPVPASLRYSARHFVCIFIKSLSICDQEHVFQATLRRSRVITRGGRTNLTVSFQLWKCSWSHGTLTQRKTMNFLCVLRLGLAAGNFSIGEQKKNMTALWLHASVQQSYT